MFAIFLALIDKRNNILPVSVTSRRSEIFDDLQDRLRVASKSPTTSLRSTTGEGCEFACCLGGG